jgi:hypothetical protein
MTTSNHPTLDDERLLQIARDTGLRHHLHGVAPAAACELLTRFVGAVLAAATTADPPPPTRHCMCADCRPAFDNGADDPKQRYDITRGVTAASADEWMVEAEKLVAQLEREWVKAVFQRCAPAAAIEARAVLLAHLSRRPGESDG